MMLTPSQGPPRAAPNTGASPGPRPRSDANTTDTITLAAFAACERQFVDAGRLSHRSDCAAVSTRLTGCRESKRAGTDGRRGPLKKALELVTVCGDGDRNLNNVSVCAISGK